MRPAPLTPAAIYHDRSHVYRQIILILCGFLRCLKADISKINREIYVTLNIPGDRNLTGAALHIRRMGHTAVQHTKVPQILLDFQIPDRDPVQQDVPRVTMGL